MRGRKPPTKSGIVDPETGCLTRPGSDSWRVSGGYPGFNLGGTAGGSSLTRLVWEAANGPIPEGLIIRHSCDNTACYLLAHLVIGTFKDNMADMYDRGRAYSQQVKRGERIHHQAHIPERAETAWKKVRGDINLAALAKHLGITRHAVSMWRAVPEKQVDKVSDFTDLPAYDIRPDLYPAPPNPPPDPWSALSTKEKTNATQ